MNLSHELPFIKFVNNLRENKSDINYDDLKSEINRKDQSGTSKYNLNMKENDDLFVVYYENNSTQTNDNIELEKGTKSLIVDKQTLIPIVNQYNNIIYNEDATEYLKLVNWDNVEFEKCYEGTLLVVYFNNDKWYVSTRRCLDAYKSSWIKNKSYGELFDESIEGKFSLNDLNTEYCYHFVLLHYKNKNIVNYSNLGYNESYKDVIHAMTTKKYTLEEIDYTINENIKKSDKKNFSNLDELLCDLNSTSEDDEKRKTISLEGYIVKVYEGEIGLSPFTVLKLQTDIYQKINNIKPNNSNIYQSYLVLYQNDILTEYLPYFSKYNNDIIKRIHTSMRTLSKEILDLYHCTRQKKNPEVYKSLYEQYKKILYGLHGLFIEYRTPKEDNTTEEKITKSITVHDVYHHLKNLPTEQLRQLFYERMCMIENNINTTYFNVDCISTTTLCTLMFQNNIRRIN